MSAESSLSRIRTDHTGGLQKPDWLLDIYARHGEGKASDAELREGQERAVREVIARQEALGLPVVSDGELRRIGGFQQSFGGAVRGYDAEPYVYRRPQSDDYTGPMRRVASGVNERGPAINNRLPVTQRLELERNLILDEYLLAASIATTPVKVTLIGPDRIAQRFQWESSLGIYDGLDDFVADVVRLEREMIAAVVAAGCRYVQIDEPGYTAYVDEPSLAQMRSRGEDPARNLQRSIDADNAIIAGFPEATFAVHICRGSGGGRGGTWFHREGSYDGIAEQVFGGLDFDRFLLEYDSEAAGSFDALRFIPKGRVAVLGLVSNHGPEVETADYLKARIEEASRFLPVDQMAICPRCGLTDAGEAAWQKLAVIQEVASEVWPSA